MEPKIRERESALSAVALSLDRARRGEGNALFIVSEAGLGKTTILGRAAADARPGMKVISGRGEPMESDIAFGLVEQVLPGFADEQSRDPSGAAPFDASVPYMSLLRRVRAETETNDSLLILLDDLHWADRDSLELFAFLARRISGLPVALVGALRPWPPEVAAMVRQLGPERAPAEMLAPLERASIDALIRERSGHELPTETAELCWRMSAGNPLLAEQISLALGRDAALPGVLDLGRAASELLLGRFTDLDGQTMALATVASTAGITFRTDVVSEAAGLDAETTDRAFEALFRNGLVEADGPGWLRFVHPLLRQSLYDDLSPHNRDRVHADLFRVLAACGFEREAAEHAIEAGLEGDEEAAALLEKVGRAARAAGAVAAAARDFEAAVRFRGDSCGPELLLLAMTSTIAAGRPVDAAPIGERLLAMADLEPGLRAEALRALAQASYLTGSGDRGDRLMTEAVDLAAEVDPVKAVRALLDQTSIAWMSEGPQAALALAERAVEMGAEAPPEISEAALALWSHLAIETGDPAGFIALAPIDLRIASGDTGHLLDPAELVWAPAAIYGYSHTLKYAERFEDSFDAMTRARDALEAAGAANGIATVSLFLGNHLVRQGRPDEALPEADRAEEFSDLTPFALPLAPLIRAEAFVWKGEFELADEHLAEARRRAIDPDGWLFRLWSSHVEALGMLWRNDAGTSDLYLEIEKLAESVGMRELSSQPWEDHAVEAHLAAGRCEDAERMTRLIEERAAAIGTDWPLSIAYLARGRMLEAEGSAEAGELFRRAVDQIADTDMPLHRAENLIAHGGWLRRNGAIVDSRPVLAEALETAEAWGGGHLARVAADELHLAGGRRRRRQPVEDRDELTPAELRVAREAAAGLTNDEIARALHLSPNTVRSHLKRVFSKLDIDSRRKLAGRLETPD